MLAANHWVTGSSARWGLVFVAVWFACAASGAARGQVPAPQAVEAQSSDLLHWLKRLHDASRNRSFVGTLVVSAGEHSSVAKIWHFCDGVDQHERVQSLTGPQRITLRRNTEVVTFDPDKNTARIERRQELPLFPNFVQMPEQNLKGFYQVRVGEPERVAGHMADRLDIVPTDPLRFAYRIWSEQKTGLTLKMQTLNHRQEVLEQLAFTELDLDVHVNPLKLQQEMKRVQGYRVQTDLVRPTQLQAEGWALKTQVPGFRPVACHVMSPAQRSGKSALQCVYTDGLASVSLFFEGAPAASQGRTAVQGATGATHAHSKELDGYWVTAMGEVPLVTVQRFTDQLMRLR